MEEHRNIHPEKQSASSYQRAIEKVCEILKEAESIGSSLVRFSIQTHCLDLVLELEGLKSKNIH